jgi:hypothetical protein
VHRSYLQATIGYETLAVSGNASAALKPVAFREPIRIIHGTQAMKPFSIFLSTCCLLFTVPVQSHATAAAAQISNLAVPWQGGGIGDIHAVTPNQRFGFSFTTGATAYQLDSIILEHLTYSGSLQHFRVELYRLDGFGLYGDVSVSFLGTLGNSVLDPRPTQWPGNTMLVRYSSPGNLALQPGTSYMIAAVEPVNGLNETGLLFAAGWTGYSVSGDWSVPIQNQLFSDSTSPWMVGNPLGGSIKIEVKATAVPEPAAISVLALSAGVLLSFRCGKRRSSSCR